MTSTAVANGTGHLRRVHPLVVLAVFYIFAVLFVSPVGDFPLNDDWVYGEGARLFMQTGRLEVPTSCSPCVLHVILGGLAGKLFGFSYTALRLLTLSIGFAGAVALYFVFIELGTGRKLSWFLTMVYLFNPLVLSLLFSFMTDIAAMSFANLYLLYLLRGILRGSKAYLWLSGAMLTCAIGVRQGSAIFVAVNLLILLFYGWRKWRTSGTLSSSDRSVFAPLIPLTIALIVVPVGAAVAADQWLQASDKISDSYIWFKKIHHDAIARFLHSPAEGARDMTVALGQVSFYLGLYCIPALLPFLALLPGLFKGKVRLSSLSFLSFLSFALSALAVGATFARVVFGDKRLMPFNQNMLRVPQVGPPNLMGIAIPMLKPGRRRVLTGVSGVAAFVLLGVLMEGARRACLIVWRAAGGSRPPDRSPGERPVARAAAAIVCFLSMALTLAGVTFETVVLDVDRHYLIALVPILICIALTQRWLCARRLYVVSLSVLLFMAGYSTCAAQDYLSWNRARWDAARALEVRGVPAADIDGGAEYNFFHDVNLWVNTFKGTDPGDTPQSKWRWWRIHGDEYILSFSTIPNYDVVDRHAYFSALSMSRQEVLTLRRVAPPSKGGRGGGRAGGAP